MMNCPFKGTLTKHTYFVSLAEVERTNMPTNLTIKISPIVFHWNIFQKFSTTLVSTYETLTGFTVHAKQSVFQQSAAILYRAQQHYYGKRRYSVISHGNDLFLKAGTQTQRLDLNKGVGLTMKRRNSLLDCNQGFMRSTHHRKEARTFTNKCTSLNTPAHSCLLKLKGSNLHILLINNYSCMYSLVKE